MSAIWFFEIFFFYCASSSKTEKRELPCFSFERARSAITSKSIRGYISPNELGQFARLINGVIAKRITLGVCDKVADRNGENSVARACDDWKFSVIISRRRGNAGRVLRRSVPTAPLRHELFNLPISLFTDIKPPSRARRSSRCIEQSSKNQVGFQLARNVKSGCDDPNPPVPTTARLRKL